MHLIGRFYSVSTAHTRINKHIAVSGCFLRFDTANNTTTAPTYRRELRGNMCNSPARLLCSSVTTCTHAAWRVSLTNWSQPIIHRATLPVDALPPLVTTAVRREAQTRVRISELFATQYATPI
jgi:hypothetical protein